MTKLVVLLLLSLFSLSECVGWSSNWYCAFFPPNSSDKATAGQSSSAKSSKPASVFMVGQPPASPVTTQVTQNTAGAEFCPTYAVPSTPSAFRAQSIDDGDTASENISVQSLNDEPSKLDDLTPLADHIRKIFEKYVANDKEMKQLINKKITQRTEKEALEEAAKFYGVAVAKLEKVLEDRDAIIVNFKTMNGEQKRAIEEKVKKIGSLILDAEILKAKHQELLGKLNETNQDRARLRQELKIHTQLVDQLREQNAKAQKEIEKLRVGNNQLLFDLRAKSNCKGKVACKSGQRDDIPERPVPNNANKCKPDMCKSNEKCNKMVRSSRTKCSLKYCNQGRCSAQKFQNTNVDPKRYTSEQNSKEQQSEQTYNRFTRVARAFTWHEGRAAETRPVVFSQCIIKRCKKNRHCRPKKERPKRTPNTCKFCATILGQCSHFRYEHERWLPNIEIKSIRQGRYRYRLEIPLNDTENMAFLDYSLVHDNDEHGTPIVHLRFIETKAPFQNKGLGTALLKHFIEEKVMKKKLRKMGKIKLDVMRGHQNVEAYGLYKKCGFVNEHPEDPSNHNMILILADYKPENCVSGKLDLV